MMELIYADNTSLDVWRQGDLTSALESFSQATPGPDHHRLANLAIVRSRLKQWELAERDARASIQVQPTILGHIAVSIALGGQGQLSTAKHEFNQVFLRDEPKNNCLLLLIKSIIVFLSGGRNEATRRVADLVEACQEADKPLCRTVQAHIFLLLGGVFLKEGDNEQAVELLRRAQEAIPHPKHPHLAVISLIFGWDFEGLELAIQQQLQECSKLFEDHADAMVSEHPTEAIIQYSAALSLNPPNAEDICVKQNNALAILGKRKDALEDAEEWARASLARGSVNEALDAATKVQVLKSLIYQAICNVLEQDGRIMEAIECFHHMTRELRAEMNTHRDWALDFRQRSSKNLVHFGDTALDSQRHDEAVSNYTTALSLDPPSPQGILIKRSKAYLAAGSWKQALDDSNQVIMLDPSSPWGYEVKHAALHKAGDYAKAIEAFETMISRLSDQAHGRQYVNPEVTKEAIRVAVQDAIHDLPRVLIDTISGRLLHKQAQADAFESLPTFNKLISSMTTRIDRAQIQQDVAEYYRYSMFSHKWEASEPLFKDVVDKDVYGLEESLTHDKLKMFCKIVRDDGLNWAWSDTCCINKEDHTVLQEALVAMFKWYEGSALTVVYLPDVPLRRLVDSIWNSRAWTLQEYHASKVVRFYNKDWTLYKGLNILNHKESPEILVEMEEATSISSPALVALRPGLEDIREKLRLASTRQSTFVEDAAYSLFGIFSVSLPAVYGERDQALGRLLAQLLTSSGDTSILAWTGKSGGFNSCLPSKISVFNQLPTSHIPLLAVSEKTITERSRNSSLNTTSVTRLYDQIDELPVPSFSGKRMKLPCLTFKLGPLSVTRSRPSQVFRAQTVALGVVEIETEADLSQLSLLYLIHPWIDFLLDRQPVGSVLGSLSENMDNQSSIGQSSSTPRPSVVALPAQKKRVLGFASRFGLPFGGRDTSRPHDAASLRSPSTLAQSDDAASLRPPSTLAQSDKEILALQALNRLRQPFGALLLASSSGNVAAYRRVAPESLITVQIEEITPTVLDKLIDSVRVLDVL